MTAETEIRELIEAWAKAVRDVDLDGIVARHTSDVVMFDVPPPVQVTGIEAYRSTWDLFFQYSSGGPGSFELTDLEVTADETAGFAHALLRVAGATARLTIGLRKVGGEWLIAHEHHSYPIEPGGE